MQAAVASPAPSTEEPRAPLGPSVTRTLGIPARSTAAVAQLSRPAVSAAFSSSVRPAISASRSRLIPAAAGAAGGGGRGRGRACAGAGPPAARARARAAAPRAAAASARSRSSAWPTARNASDTAPTAAKPISAIATAVAAVESPAAKATIAPTAATATRAAAKRFTQPRIAHGRGSQRRGAPAAEGPLERDRGRERDVVAPRVRDDLHADRQPLGRAAAADRGRGQPVRLCGVVKLVGSTPVCPASAPCGGAGPADTGERRTS